MKNYILLLLIFVSFQLVGQDTINIKHPNGHLLGLANRQGLEDSSYDYWFVKNYKAYKPDQKIVKKLTKSIQGISVVIFMGTWCHDSKRVIPRFYKIMDNVGFNYAKNLRLIAINRAKETPNKLHVGYNITRSPALIFYKNGKEIGRFVEHARETLEKDMLKIIREKPYKHPYQK